MAVSGLGGHVFGSFKERDGNYLWLRDALPEDLPGARIIIYGHDSKVAGSTSFQDIDALGKTLRAGLQGVRYRREEQRKPLILIGHSLGGLICKEAIIQMGSGDEVDHILLKSIYSILFFGCPNNGKSNSTFSFFRH